MDLIFKKLNIFSISEYSSIYSFPAWSMNIKKTEDGSIPISSKKHNEKLCLEMIPDYSGFSFFAAALPLLKDWSTIDLSKSINNSHLCFYAKFGGRNNKTFIVLTSSDTENNEQNSTETDIENYAEKRDDGWIYFKIPLFSLVESKEKFNKKSVRLLKIICRTDGDLLLSDLLIEQGENDYPSLNKIDQIINESKNYKSEMEKAGVKDSWWFNNDNIYNWVNTRCLEELRPFLEQIPLSRFLVVGGGRGGYEGEFIGKIGHYVHTTDIVKELLEEIKRNNYADEVSVEDGENLSFENEYFDWCFIKEALHHFPKPYMGIYEMLRVSKYGCILVEPIDSSPENINSNFWYEDVGNFLYTFSKKELIKCAYGLGCHQISFIQTPDTTPDGPLYKLVKGIPTNGSEFTINKPELDKRWIEYKENIAEDNKFNSFGLLITIFIKNKLSNRIEESIRSNPFSSTINIKRISNRDEQS